jgi:hypothetical protein
MFERIYLTAGFCGSHSGVVFLNIVVFLAVFSPPLRKSVKNRIT